MRKVLKKPGAKGGGKTLRKPRHIVTSPAVNNNKEKKMTLTKPTKLPPPPKTGPEPVIPKGWEPKGKRTKFNGEKVVFVKPDDMPQSFPRLNPFAPPDTFWRVKAKSHKDGLQLVTIMPNGVHIGWDTCAVCLNSAKRCICKDGIMHTRGIEHIYITTLAKSEGDELDSPVNIQHPSFTSRGRFWYRNKAASGPVGHVVRASSRPKHERPADGRPRPSGKALSKPRLSKPAPKPEFDASKVDLAKVNKDATSKAVDATTAAMEALTGKKTLRKK